MLNCSNVISPFVAIVLMSADDLPRLSASRAVAFTPWKPSCWMTSPVTFPSVAIFWKIPVISLRSVPVPPAAVLTATRDASASSSGPPFAIPDVMSSEAAAAASFSEKLVPVTALSTEFITPSRSLPTTPRPLKRALAESRPSRRAQPFVNATARPPATTAPAASAPTLSVVVSEDIASLPADARPRVSELLKLDTRPLIAPAVPRVTSEAKPEASAPILILASPMRSDDTSPAPEPRPKASGRLNEREDSRLDHLSLTQGLLESSKCRGLTLRAPRALRNDLDVCRRLPQS